MMKNQHLGTEGNLSLNLAFPASADDFFFLFFFDKWTEHEYELVLQVFKYRASGFGYPQGVSTDMEQSPSAVHQLVVEINFFFPPLNVKF